jgi:serine protease Do
MVTHTALALNAAYILPIPTLVYVKEQLSLQDKIPHGYLGVEFTLKETMGELPSILIAKIMPESPAAKGGLKAHDQILKINDQAIESMADLRQATFHLQPGQMIQITLNRQSQIKILTIKLD